MKSNDLTSLVRNFYGLMPESTRTELAFRLAMLVEQSLVTPPNLLALDKWRKDGMASFMRQCMLTTTVRPVVPYTISVEETKLAEFCNRWMNVSEFKLADEPPEAMRPISVELNGLRSSMINELKALAGLTVTELPEEVQ
jgi:hypothetical protein